MCLLINKMLAVIKLNVHGTFRPYLQRVATKLVLNLMGGAIDPCRSAHVDSADGGMMSDLFGDEGELARDVEFESFSEEGVEGFGRAACGGGIVGEDEGGDEGGSLRTGGEGGLVEEVGVFDIFGKTLEEGERLVEDDGESDTGEVFADGVFENGPEVGAFGGS